MKPRGEGVTAGAYWRDPIALETKVDWQTIEIAEDQSVREASRALGVLLAWMQDAYLDWLETSRATTPIPDHGLVECKRIFARLAVSSYWDGAGFVNTSLDRAMSATEQKPLRRPGVTPATMDRVAKRGEQSGEKFHDGIRNRLLPIVDSAFSMTGQRVKSLELLEREIRSVFAGYIESELRFETAKRTGLIKTAEQFLRWTRKKLPKVRWIEREIEDAEIRSKPTPVLTPKLNVFELRTERTRYFAHGARDTANRHEMVESLEFSAIRDDRMCDVCSERDQVIRPKNDAFWQANTPPMHPSCRCVLVPVVETEDYTHTAKTNLPTQEGVAEGFGGYDTEKVRTARALRIPA